MVLSNRTGEGFSYGRRNNLIPSTFRANPHKDQHLGQPLLGGSRNQRLKRSYKGTNLTRQNIFIVVASLAILYVLFVRGTASTKNVGYAPLGNFAEVLAPKSKASLDPHPIITLLNNARSYHTTLITQQSTSLSKATSQYKQRYRRPPPPGFSKWFQYARKQNHTLIDEYDQLMLDLEPYFSVAPATLIQRTRTLGQLSGVSIVSIKDGKSEVHSKSGRWAPALAFQEMISDFVDQLPDMDIAISEKLEGRILPERKDFGIDESFEGESDLERQKRKEDPLAELLPFPPVWKEEEFGSTWESFRRACPPGTAARRITESIRYADADDLERQRRLAAPGFFNQPFVVQINDAKKNTTRRKESTRLDSVPTEALLPPLNELQFQLTTDAHADICRRPSLHSSHSAFYTDTRAIPYLYPLFSPSKPHGYADLLIPSHHYWSPSSEVTYDWEFKQGRTEETNDVPWEEKGNKMFWRGKVTKGAETPRGNEQHYQKNRLVAYANDDGGLLAGEELEDVFGHHLNQPIPESKQPLRSILTLNSSDGSVSSLSAPVGRLNQLTMDVAFSCDPKFGECQHLQNQGYRVDVPRPISQSWKHKYLLDLDEVGMSPKFLALMESRCAVLKATIQREFWSNWILPWYHYIPVSSSYNELHNIQSFFSGFPDELVASAVPLNQLTSNSSGLPDNALTSMKEAAAHRMRRRDVTIQTNNRTILANVKGPSAAVKSIDPLAEPGTLFNGDKALQDIGLAGSRWKRRHVRKEDMQVYVYRLLIEWAAVLDGSRHD